MIKSDQTRGRQVSSLSVVGLRHCFFPPFASFSLIHEISGNNQSVGSTYTQVCQVYPRPRRHRPPSSSPSPPHLAQQDELGAAHPPIGRPSI